MQLSCFLHEIEAKAGTGGAGVDAMERFEHLLAFVNGYARTFIADIYGSCCTHPDDNGAPAAAVIDGIADEVDDRHLNDRRLDRQQGFCFARLEIELVTGIHRNRGKIGRDAFDENIQILLFRRQVYRAPAFREAGVRRG